MALAPRLRAGCVEKGCAHLLPRTWCPRKARSRARSSLKGSEDLHLSSGLETLGPVLLSPLPTLQEVCSESGQREHRTLTPTLTMSNQTDRASVPSMVHQAERPRMAGRIGATSGREALFQGTRFRRAATMCRHLFRACTKGPHRQGPRGFAPRQRACDTLGPGPCCGQTGDANRSQDAQSICVRVNMLA